MADATVGAAATAASTESLLEPHQETPAIDQPLPLLGAGNETQDPDVLEEYDPVYWNTRPFPTDRTVMTKELKLAKKKYPEIDMRKNNQILKMTIIQLRAGTYAGAAAVESATTAAAAAPQKEPAFVFNDDKCACLITELFLDPHFVEARTRLQGGETGGPDGTLNRCNTTSPAAGGGGGGGGGGGSTPDREIMITSKATAWQDVAHGFIDLERQKYSNFAVVHQEKFTTAPCFSDLSDVLLLDPT